jgi:cell division septal protein FtsQ
VAERRIKTVGRPSYGRPVPPRSRARRRPSFHLGLIPKRILILLASTLIITLILGQVFKVSSIVVKPATSPASTTEEVRKIMSAHWSMRNTLTFNASTFTQDLMAVDASIKSVVVKRQLPGGLIITVALKQPSLGWMTGSDGHLLDADGTAIGPLPVGSKLPLVIDDSNLPVTTGQAVVSPRFVSFVTASAIQIPNTGLGITKYEIKDTTLDLYLSTNRGYQLILDTSRPVGDEVTDLKAVLANLKLTNKTPAQYIDLRISGRAYYK